MKSCTLVFNNKQIKIDFNDEVPDSLIKYLPDAGAENYYKINGDVKILKDGIQRLTMDFKEADKIETLAFNRVSRFEVNNGMRLRCISKPVNAKTDVSYRFVNSSITNAPINRESCFVLDKIEDGSNYEHIIMANSADRFDIVQLVAKSSNLINRRATYILE